MNFTKTFQLIQYTPMVHFQALETGATLRMTELKPKLDRFLIEHHFKSDFDAYKHLLQGYHPEKEKLAEAKKSGSYRLSLRPSFAYSVVADGKGVEHSDPATYHRSLYFGNMGQDGNTVEESRRCAWARGGVQVTIRSLHAQLLESIQGSLPGFLATTNFGTRQNKGWGSFYLDKATHGSEPWFRNATQALKALGKTYLYWKYDNLTVENCFKDIHTIYSLMKSGINFPDKKNGGAYPTYYRSALYYYFWEELKIDCGSEKRLIKESFFGNSRLTTDGKSKLYMRAVLGIPGYFEYNDSDRKGKILVSNDEIERLASPLLFKIVGNSVFIIPVHAQANILNKSFVFQESWSSNKRSILTPSTFNLPDFLAFFKVYFDDIKYDQFSDYGEDYKTDRRITAATKAIRRSIGETDLKIHQP